MVKCKVISFLKYFSAITIFFLIGVSTATVVQLKTSIKAHHHSSVDFLMVNETLHPSVTDSDRKAVLNVYVDRHKQLSKIKYDGMKTNDKAKN
jgi:hypothetical protein